MVILNGAIRSLKSIYKPWARVYISDIPPAVEEVYGNIP